MGIRLLQNHSFLYIYDGVRRDVTELFDVTAHFLVPAVYLKRFLIQMEQNGKHKNAEFNNRL